MVVLGGYEVVFVDGVFLGNYGQTRGAPPYI